MSARKINLIYYFLINNLSSTPSSQAYAREQVIPISGILKANSIHLLQHFKWLVCIGSDIAKQLDWQKVLFLNQAVKQDCNTSINQNELIMKLIVMSIFPIILCLLLGYGLGLILPRYQTRHASKLLTPLIWLLLFFCGKEFGHVLGDGPILMKALTTALTFAAFTALLPWMLILLCIKRPRTKCVSSVAVQLPTVQFFYALRDCMIALAMIAMGAFASTYHGAWLNEITAAQLLYALIFLVGIDLAWLEFDRVGYTSEIVLVPTLVIIGSLLGGTVAGFYTGETMLTSLALSSGFGWVTLSSILVSGKLGSSYGAIAMLTDLFREMIAIIMLYLLGARFSREAIGICGATALDATLPLIRQKCGAQHVLLALISGFVLTLTSPALILIFLTGN